MEAGKRVFIWGWGGGEEMAERMVPETKQGRPGPSFTCAMQSYVFPIVEEHSLAAPELMVRLCE